MTTPNHSWGELNELRAKSIERLRAIINDETTKHRQLCIAIRELRLINAQEMVLDGQSGDNDITVRIEEVGHGPASDDAES